MLNDIYYHVIMITMMRQSKSRSIEFVEARCSGFVSRCRREGIRVTPQRMAVFKALIEDTTHPTADTVYSRLRHSMPALSLATVYRILETLDKEGLIRRVGTANGVSRFEANLDIHQHMVCKKCGSIIDIEHESLSQLRPPNTRLAGFMAENLDIRIIGICSECRRTP